MAINSTAPREPMQRNPSRTLNFFLSSMKDERWIGKKNLDKTDMLLIGWKSDSGTGIQLVPEEVMLPQQIRFVVLEYSLIMYCLGNPRWQEENCLLLLHHLSSSLSRLSTGSHGWVKSHGDYCNTFYRAALEYLGSSVVAARLLTYALYCNHTVNLIRHGQNIYAENKLIP